MLRLPQCEEFVVKITQDRAFQTSHNKLPPELELLMNDLETSVQNTSYGGLKNFGPEYPLLP